MKIVFSRKGFDSAAGGAPSPVAGGVPVSLPIPAGAASATSYGDLGFGDLVERATRGRILRDALCHHDPMFIPGGECLFGQCGAAQTHLANRGVGVGDTFLFFGLFQGKDGGRHHRIFAYMQVDAVQPVARLDPAERHRLLELGHPHVLAMHGRNDTIYRGPGCCVQRADPALRLTVPEGPPSLWQVPRWLRETGLSYHERESRWMPDGRLQSVSRGQEFVCDVGARARPRRWLEEIVGRIRWQSD